MIIRLKKFGNEYEIKFKCCNLNLTAEEWDRHIQSHFYNRDDKFKIRIGCFVWWDYVHEKNINSNYEDFKLLEDKYVKKYEPDLTEKKNYLELVKREYRNFIFSIRKETKFKEYLCKSLGVKDNA